MEFPTWKFAQRVLLAHPLAYARPASSIRPTTGPGLEFPNLEILPASITRPTSLRICIILQISVLHNYTDQLIHPARRLAQRVSKSVQLCKS